jgi:hypothetical protein
MSGSTSDTRCPSCGARLELVKDGLIEEPYAPGGYLVRDQPVPRRQVARPFYACPSCEFCIETRDWRHP